MSRFFLTLCLLLASTFAQASTTYTYTGTTYTGAISPYTMSMSVTGSFTVATALPANFTGDITGQVTSFSFSDGVLTYSNTSAAIYSFNVVTDSSGAMIDTDIIVNKWETGSSPHTTSDYLDYVVIGSTGTSVFNHGDCGAVSADICTNVAGGYLLAISEGGSWARSTTAVPTLSEWGLVIMAMLMLLAFLPYRPVRR